MITAGSGKAYPRPTEQEAIFYAEDYARWIRRMNRRVDALRRKEARMEAKRKPTIIRRGGAL